MGTVRASRAKRWTYLIVLVLLFGSFIVLNYVIGDYDSAKSGVKKFLSLPGWLYPIIVGALGLIIFWFGTKIEADWPEVLGAGLISIAVAVGEIMIGWEKFALGGLSIMPVLIPIGVFLIFLVVGMLKTR
ncbi:MAG: hypothetical protein RBU30_16230 [Polyangia bacterium]|jgi:hypothetical protein|nr:hypothetical protein [Polyangia bacterium]